jgi:hypothetical protein
VVLGEEEWALAGLLHTGAAGSGVSFYSSSALSKYVFFSSFPWGFQPAQNVADALMLLLCSFGSVRNMTWDVLWIQKETEEMITKQCRGIFW